MTHKQFSAKGGKAGTGDAKARTSEQARAAVAARWAKTKRKPKRAAIDKVLCADRGLVCWYLEVSVEWRANKALHANGCG